MSDSTRTRISRATAAPWIEVAQTARVNRDILARLPAPRDGSPFKDVDELYPSELVSLWCRSYLAAALEHLLLWADFAAPLKFTADAVVEHYPRPAQTLARAALESSSQAVWLLAANTVPELLHRHFVLVLADLDEQQKAAVSPEEKAAIRSAHDELRTELTDLGMTEKELRPQRYLDLVKLAAAETATHWGTPGVLAEPALVERAWRASAGSAHGKRWPSLELTVLHDGRQVPDPTAMTTMLKLADAVTTYGVARFADRSGYADELPLLLQDAASQLMAIVPKRTDSDDDAAEGQL